MIGFEEMFYTSSGTTFTGLRSPAPGVNSMISDHLDRISKLDNAQRHMVRTEAEIERLVLDRLSEGLPENNPNTLCWLSSVWSEWELWRGISLYAKLRHEATRRDYENERVSRRAHEDQARTAGRKGRMLPGFYSFKAYAPKRGWMQGRPRR